MPSSRPLKTWRIVRKLRWRTWAIHSSRPAIFLPEAKLSFPPTGPPISLPKAELSRRR
jgi:hypothetical protein